MTRAGNLRGAPLFLRPAVVRGLIEGVDALRKGVVEVPVAPIKLVDVPRRSEDPRLAKANDDAPLRPTIASPVACEPEDWPDAPLPDHADPDLDRAEPAEGGQPEPEAAGCTYADQRKECDQSDQAGGAGSAWPDPLGREGGADRQGGAFGRVLRSNGHSDRPGLGRHDRCGGYDPNEAKNRHTAAGPAARNEREQLRHRSVRRVSQEPGTVRTVRPDRLLASAEKALRPDQQALGGGNAADLIPNSTIGNGIALKRAPKIDVARLVRAHRTKDAAAPKKVRAPLFPAPSREACPRCGIAGWKGCAHFLPFEDALRSPPQISAQGCEGIDG